jgi:hypothetical protein
VRISGVTRRDLEAMRLLRDEMGVLRRGDRRAAGTTMARLARMGFVCLIRDVFAEDRVARYVLTQDGEDHLAAREGRGPSCWSLVVDGVPACCSTKTECLPVGCSSSRRSELRRWKQIIERHFPQARVELVPGACDQDLLKKEG